jgi:hypothetical protein
LNRSGRGVLSTAIVVQRSGFEQHHSEVTPRAERLKSGADNLGLDSQPRARRDSGPTDASIEHLFRFLASLFKTETPGSPKPAKFAHLLQMKKLYRTRRFILFTRLLRILAFVFVSNHSIAQMATPPPMNTAKGTFEIKMTPATNAIDPSITTMSIDKQMHGDLEGATKGEMLAAGDPTKGAAGYVAIEQVTGKLNGKTGSFALMHFATMTPGSPNELKVIVVPGTGTGELTGIYGTFTITIDHGQHFYTLEYSFR